MKDWEVRSETDVLGKVFKKGGPRAGEESGKSVRIVLRYVAKKDPVQPHKPANFVVYTSCPLPKKQ
jgi:hypothetical protein